MSLKGLNQFQHFDLPAFVRDKTLAYLKSAPWKDGDVEVGSKVTVQVVEDRTRYTQPDLDNFGEQLTVKVRDVPPSAFSQLRPLGTEVIIKEVERAVIYGDFRNNLAIIGKIAVKDAPAGK